jgi:1-deoxy-D-xylulose-5-phosphate synthase
MPRHLYSAYLHRGLTAVRYPRGAGIGAPERKEMSEIPLGTAQMVRQGSHVAILVFGTVLAASLEAAEAIGATVVNMRFVKPLDLDMVRKMAESHDFIVTIEENVVAGGAGSAINEIIASQQISVPVLNLGLPDQYIDHASQQQQLAECGLDAQGIINSINESVYFQPGQTKHSKLI